MGPSVKFVLAIIDSISKKKWGLIFFPQNWTRRGWGGPRASCLWTQKLLILIFEYFPNKTYSWNITEKQNHPYLSFKVRKVSLLMLRLNPSAP